VLRGLIANSEPYRFRVGICPAHLMFRVHRVIDMAASGQSNVCTPSKDKTASDYK
jgi:hypothetical protein